MPTFTYPTINTVAPTTRSKGSSDTTALQSMFPGTPGVADFGGTSGAEAYKQQALDILLKNEITDNLQTGAVDRDFGVNASDARRRPPNFEDVATGGGGLPASAWLPNPASPGAGSVDPRDQPAPPAGVGITPTNSIANTGNSVDTTQPGRNPATSSQRMALGRESGPYVAGQSPATANAS